MLSTNKVKDRLRKLDRDRHFSHFVHDEISPGFLKAVPLYIKNDKI